MYNQAHRAESVYSGGTAGSVAVKKDYFAHDKIQLINDETSVTSEDFL